MQCRIILFIFYVLFYEDNFVLMLYSIYLKNIVFSALNSMTSIGVLINMVYKIKAGKVTTWEE